MQPGSDDAPPRARLRDVLVGRADEQIAWYDERSRRCQRLFKSLKAIQIVAAASIPVLVSVDAQPWISAANGSLIVILEGIQQMNQYQQLWVSYRATAEALKHEKYLFFADARPYASLDDAQAEALFAERIESQISQEDSKWRALHQPSVGASEDAKASS